MSLVLNSQVYIRTLYSSSSREIRENEPAREFGRRDVIQIMSNGQEVPLEVFRQKVERRQVFLTERTELQNILIPVTSDPDEKFFSWSCIIQEIWESIPT